MSLEIENNQKPPVELARRWLMRIFTFFPSFFTLQPTESIYIHACHLIDRGKFDNHRHRMILNCSFISTETETQARFYLLDLSNETDHNSSFVCITKNDQ
ncbi:hypothetical protein T01_5780 [Trichinella spiralis]|uniref:Uncharacterized protein n=1 Tax=Trichinella spiralis TaxID=6334 RepID=A0A0V1BR96_TRISP|nr:hypothetical protein T01_5780 [Trichinella spiralis]